MGKVAKITVSFHNCQDLVFPLYSRLRDEMFGRKSGYKMRLKASGGDRTIELVRRIATVDRRVKIEGPGMPCRR